MSFEKYSATEGSKSNKALLCESTVNKALFEEEDDVLVIDKCPPGELHLVTGIVNHIFWNGLVPLLGFDKALKWPKKLFLVPKDYYGRIFEGNACKVKFCSQMLMLSWSLKSGVT